MSSADDRALAQRTRILDAAQVCFQKSGFHCGSMATIAQTADMSAGLIYRYFENKNAIILAIIASQLDIIRQRIRDLRAAEDLGAALLDYFDSQCDPEQRQISVPLFLEMSAEATRDPEIAQAVRQFDDTILSEFTDWLSRSPENNGFGLPQDIAAERALGLMCLIEGLKVRKARNPDMDRALLKKAIDASLTNFVKQLPPASPAD